MTPFGQPGDPSPEDAYGPGSVAYRRLSASARRQVLAVLRNSDLSPAAQFAEIRRLLDRHESAIVHVLSLTHLAAMLAGARQVVAGLAGTTPSSVPPTPDQTGLPAAPSPAQAAERAAEFESILAQAKALPAEMQLSYVRALPAPQGRKLFRELVTPDPGALKRLRMHPWKPPEPPTVRPKVVESVERPRLVFPIIEEATRDLESRRLMLRPEFDELTAEARREAFTVAGVESEKTLAKIQEILVEQTREGIDTEEFKRAIEEKIGKDTFLSEAHADNVVRTNAQTGFAKGQDKILENPLVDDAFPYQAYHAIHDDRVRKEHKALESYGISGTNIYRRDDPVAKLFTPPWSWQCRCSRNFLSVASAAAKGIPEAAKWLETGQRPLVVAHVPMPPFRPPPGFDRGYA